MGEVAAVFTYPLTGAHGVDHHEAPVPVLLGGLGGDRRFVLYNPATNERVGMKQYPRLTCLRAENTADGALLVTSESPLPADGGKFILSPMRGNVINVNEFGDRTPATDCGDYAAHFFSKFVDSDVRLAKKEWRWSRGDTVHASARRVAPIHIVNAASVEALREGPKGVAVGPERFRPNLVVQGFEPLAELNWRDTYLQIGNFAVRVTRATERCRVPGFDPDTGENLRDVPRLYKSFPHANEDGTGSPVFGVYGYPVVKSVDTYVSKGDHVTVLR
ncbi:MAG TPA: MOSC N-terminal beta barrel domain-containing protein [Candidatus Saccharimonadales bacterium]|nr:MOSC N-terminal beta barrel domain-containing protein [Candidatus Saccharimonadales bacterium]